jgi:hypothetical protein
MAKNRFKKIFTEAAEAFNGEYREEINLLLGLSRQDIDLLAPGTTDLETYLALIKIVEEGSRNNLSEAQLVDNIKKAGEIAVKIAKKIPRFTALL